jgi:small subunit ribosomal protein S16
MREVYEMAVKIRLTRTGRKKLPSYRVVVADSEAPRDGKFLERVGTYDPKENPARFQVDEQLTLRWLRKGAQPTETVKSLLKKAGIWKKYLDEKREKPAVA